MSTASQAIAAPQQFGNQNISNTAARYVAKAMTRVHPLQRAELLDAIIKHAEGARQIVGRAA